MLKCFLRLFLDFKELKICAKSKDVYLFIFYSDSPSKERRPEVVVPASKDPTSPSLASRLRATVGVESPKIVRQDRAQVDELDLKKLSPLSQFKKLRQIHQQQIEQNNR